MDIFLLNCVLRRMSSIRYTQAQFPRRAPAALAPNFASDLWSADTASARPRKLDNPLAALGPQNKFSAVTALLARPLVSLAS